LGPETKGCLRFLLTLLPATKFLVPEHTSIRNDRPSNLFRGPDVFLQTALALSRGSIKASIRSLDLRTHACKPHPQHFSSRLLPALTV
jgi:hypothetical protein